MSKLVKCPNCKCNFDVTVKPTTNKESNYLWIFDNGHGGIIDGVYQTAGKRSPLWPDGEILYEGEFNRGIVNRLVKLCNDLGIECVNLVDTQKDVPLSDRTTSANNIANATDKPCIYVSIHGGSCLKCRVVLFFDSKSRNALLTCFSSKPITSQTLAISIFFSQA